jgi:hypothetical protein
MDNEGNIDPAFEAELAASLKRTQELARRNRGQRPEVRGQRSEVSPVTRHSSPVTRPAHDFRPVVGDEQLPPSDRQEGGR